jgi:hypothetical protein
MEKSIDEFQKKLSWDTHNYVLGASDGDELIGIAGLRRERGAKIHHTAVFATGPAAQTFSSFIDISLSTFLVSLALPGHPGAFALMVGYGRPVRSQELRRASSLCN